MAARRTGSVIGTTTLSAPSAIRSGSSPKGRRPMRPTSRPNTSRNQAIAASGPAVNIRTHDQLTPQERRFLEAAEHGDRPTLLACLTQKNVPLNVNCVDSLGRSALEISVDNENFEIVELLLQQHGIKIGNALLCAIREGVYLIVELLVNHQSITVEMLGDGWSKSLDPNEVAISEYSNDVSPIMLAAHLNRFEILQMLLRKGATIQKPHKHSCICEDCDQARLDDSLQHSLKRINTYRALASPAWMSLTSSDPILFAFHQSSELEHLAVAENEFKESYLELSEQCKQFACDLLSQCRSTEEVIAILNKSENTTDENVEVWASKLSLSRLKLAIKYEQKMFVSHPHTQQLLTSIWQEGIPIRRQRDSRWNFLLYLLLIILWPVLSICYIVMPKSKIGKIVRRPFMKFLSYSTSFTCFLILLTFVTLEAYQSGKDEKSRAADRGAPPTTTEALIVLWVLGMLWSEIKQLWEEGMVRYVRQWWNWLDFSMNALYLIAISIRLSAYYIYVFNNDGEIPRYLSRAYWHAYEPILVAEALFAVGNVLSFARIIYLFQISPLLGPLQISLGCMLEDVAKFTIIFALIISSFALGMSQLYWYYEPITPLCVTPDSCSVVTNVFSSIGESYITLLWSLFSITKVEDTDVAESHDFTQLVGRFLFLLYHMASIIVLLNMLIAMLSLSFQTINDHADREWKFHRSKLWMTHFEEGSSLAPPFNIIVTPKALYYAFISFVNTIKWLTGRYQYRKDRNRATIRRPGYSRKSKEIERRSTMEGGEPPAKKQLTYSEIIQRLVSRFIHQRKKDVKMDGISEDSLLEIKQDISSLRYELRDDRRTEVARSSSQIETAKREIMRTVSMTTTRILPPSHRQVRPRTSVAEEDSDYLEDSDQEIKSRQNSLLTSPLSPTTSNQFDLQPPIAAEARKHSLLSHTTPISPAFSGFSAPRSSTIKQTDVIPPSSSGNPELRTSLEAVERLRDFMNEQLDELLAQMSASAGNKESTVKLPEPSEIPRTRTPASAPPRSAASPSRVAFSLTPLESP